MAFTQQCFIRKNTPELREKLEEIGRKLLFAARNGYGNVLFTMKGELGLVQAYNGLASTKTIIDCGTNEEMFLALAALRNDTDRNQWFVDDVAGVWERSESELSSKYMQLNGHKATAEEIVEHFKGEKEIKH